MTDSIAARHAEVLERMDTAARKSGRSGEDVQLVVVTKSHPVAQIAELIELGVRDVGENRVEEALFKQQILADRPEINWHMIGHVQSRKADDVCGNFSLVHSVDRLKLANRLNRRADELGIIVPVLLQFNVSAEATKSGWQASVPDRWPALLPEIEAVLQCPQLAVQGLMTMAPYSTDPEAARPYFARLRALREFLSMRFPHQRWDQLSMGMSGDFETGIEEGATIVRIGTAILGER